MLRKLFHPVSRSLLLYLASFVLLKFGQNILNIKLIIYSKGFFLEGAHNIYVLGINKWDLIISQAINYFLVLLPYAVMMFAVLGIISVIFKRNRNLPWSVFIISLSFLVTSISFDTALAKNGKVYCGKFFYKCTNGWHYDKNYLGHNVDVHYSVNYKGERTDNWKGCGYDATAEEYHELLLSIPNTKLESVSENQNVYTINSQRIILNKKEKPYLDDSLVSIDTRSYISSFMFKGTECESESPYN